jgi:hypothetical protein
MNGIGLEWKKKNNRGETENGLERKKGTTVVRLRKNLSRQEKGTIVLIPKKDNLHE